MEQKQHMAFPYRQRFILLVDVGQETWEKIPLSESESKTMLGGRLLALGLWDKYAEYENLGSQAYESGNPIVIAAGSASDISLACCDSFTLVTRSQLTGQLSVNTSNGPLARALHGCGYSAMVIVGRFRRLSGFEIDFNSVQFSNAEKFHDFTTKEVATHFLGKNLIALGPAGEHQVPYASIWSDGTNFGRGGVGTVFGLKNIKYITLAPSVSGRESYDPKQLGTTIQKYQRTLQKSKVGDLIAKEGSVTLIEQANRYGWAAVDCFSLRRDGRLWGLSSYRDFKAADPAVQGCAGCPNGCAHSSGEGSVFPDFSMGLALGANLELFDYQSVSLLMDRCSETGLDYYSIGAVLAWARKTRPEGTLSFLPDLSRATVHQYLHLIDAMAYRKGTGEQLSHTLDKLVTLYGGAEYAYAVNSIPLAPYDLRALPAQALLTALGDDTVVIRELLSGNHYRRGKERQIAMWAMFSQDLRYAMESLGLCYFFSLPCFDKPFLWYPFRFYRKSMFSFFAELVSVTEGYTVTGKQVASYGRDAWALQRKIDKMLLKGEPVGTLPDQVLVNASSNFPAAQVVPLARLLDTYYQMRGIK
ncbi:aldehyde ferredoxin oxidoreductase N-terminal domain-containing protein [Sphaerochaeta pleomorpha]|nr:aldehyde ferredoxin oxidoreductase N-terminal domain-containing protein [Sphaerochaeta pleomorpha]